MAQVVNIDGEKLRVHFEGWNSTFDEDIRMGSPKVTVMDYGSCLSGPIGCGVVSYMVKYSVDREIPTF